MIAFYVASRILYILAYLCFVWLQEYRIYRETGFLDRPNLFSPGDKFSGKQAYEKLATSLGGAMICSLIPAFGEMLFIIILFDQAIQRIYPPREADR